MQAAIARFLQYLEVERNASALTIKSYREDLTALVEYLTACHGRPPRPEQISTPDLRGYLAALHEAEYAKTTISRRLASLRSFFRFGQRDGWAQDQSGQTAPQSAQAADATPLLVQRRHGPAAGHSGRRRCDGPARPRDSRGALLGRLAGQRAGRPERRRSGSGRRIDSSAGQGQARANRPARLVRRPSSERLAAGSPAIAADQARPRGTVVREQVRQPADDAQRCPDAREASPHERARPADHAAHATAQLRHAPARPRGRHP